MQKIIAPPGCKIYGDETNAMHASSVTEAIDLPTLYRGGGDSECTNIFIFWSRLLPADCSVAKEPICWISLVLMVCQYLQRHLFGQWDVSLTAQIRLFNVTAMTTLLQGAETQPLNTSKERSERACHVQSYSTLLTSTGLMML